MDAGQSALDDKDQPLSESVVQQDAGSSSNWAKYFLGQPQSFAEDWKKHISWLPFGRTPSFPDWSVWII